MFESELVTVALITVGLLSFSWWVRTPRRDGGIREWEGSLFNSHILLLMIPGMGMWSLVALWSLLVGDSAWILLAVIPMVLGFVMLVWGLLFLPIPRWFLPRDVRARAKARDA